MAAQIARSPPRVLSSSHATVAGRYHGAADHAFTTWVRALDAAVHKLRLHQMQVVSGPSQSDPLAWLDGNLYSRK
jgi:hypothetical protein